MMIGCGYCVKTIRRGRYLYFWHYEDRGGRREQVEEYIGPSADPQARETVARRVSAYADRAPVGMGRVGQITKAERAEAGGKSPSLFDDNNSIGVGPLPPPIGERSTISMKAPSTRPVPK